MTRKQFSYLAFLVFKRGGVAGAIRRIIYRWKGIFNANMIYGRLREKYPLLIPNGMQLLDCISAMERQGKIQAILSNAWDTFYRLAPMQLCLKFT